MARRHGATAKRPASKPRSINRRESKIKRWERADDIPLDEEDQFHAARDKILLEGGDLGGDDDGEEDEVFGLKGLSDSEDDQAEEDEDEDFDEEEIEEPTSNKKQKKTKTKSKKKELPPSSDQSDAEEEETWGRKKSAYYSSNAAQIESDDEEANELEEQEAKRLQSKARGTMAEDDFGLGDSHETVPDVDMEDVEEPVVRPTIQPSKQDKQSVIRNLEKNCPETLALARDWEDTAWKLTKSQQKLAALEKEVPDALSLGMVHLYYQALLTYATTLAFYFHLRASDKYVQNPELLRSHPVLSRLLTLKQSLSTLEELDFDVSDSESEEDGSDLDDLVDAEQLWSLDKKKGLDADELRELLMDAEEITAELDSNPRLKIRSVSKPSDEPPKKKRKTAKSSDKLSAPVFDLIEPEFVPSSKGIGRAGDDSMDMYGEATSLQYADAADKSASKKSLRFHTSKIESVSARRQNARTRAVGGDDDLPYRERKKEKDARLAKEAKNKVKEQGGDDLDDIDPEVEDMRKNKKNRDNDEQNSEDDVGGYYELVKRKSKESKEKKKVDYEAAVAASQPDLDEDGSSGPRSLTRAILANKGLTPHRSKSVRNPRVKKRQKFEKAKKKVASQKAIYKGGMGDVTKYSGESSGISKVVKSIRLG